MKTKKLKPGRKAVDVSEKKVGIMIYVKGKNKVRIHPLLSAYAARLDK